MERARRHSLHRPLIGPTEAPARKRAHSNQYVEYGVPSLSTPVWFTPISGIVGLKIQPVVSSGVDSVVPVANNTSRLSFNGFAGILLRYGPKRNAPVIVGLELPTSSVKLVS